MEQYRTMKSTLLIITPILFIFLLIINLTEPTGATLHVPVIEYDNDTFYLAALINSECGICDEEEKILVASTVLNRASEQGVEIQAAIFQPNQYAGTKSRHFYCTDRNYRLSQSILNGTTQAYPKIKYFVTHSHYNKSFAKNMDKEYIIEAEYHKYF